MGIEAQPASGRDRWALLIPLILTAVIYISTGSRAVIDYDEGHYSQVAKQMIERNDWVTPYDNGVRFLEKPPLMYWATAASFRIFGVTEFALRLPAAFAVIALVWVVMRMAQRASGVPGAVVAGLCTAFSAGTFLFTREALHDIWLVLFLTLSMHAFLEWHRSAEHSLRPALLFYAALAGAVMTKSLVGVAFPVGATAVFFLLGREWPRWRDMHLLPGVTLFLVLVVPWHWLAAVRNQDFLWSFFVNEQFLRFLGRHDPPVVWSIPLLTFWALLPVWFFPWTAFLPAAWSAGRKPANAGEGAAVRLSFAWLIVILGFYAISGRLEHYAFPVLPALSLLVGVALARRDEISSVKWAFRGLAAFGAIVLAACLCAGVWLVSSGYRFEKGSTARTSVISETDFSILAEMPAALQRELRRPAAVTVCALALAFAGALWFEIRRKRLWAVFSIASGMMVACWMVHWSLIICEDLISSRKFALAVAREARPGDHLVVLGDFESANSLTFYQPLPLQVCDGVAYSLIPGMKYPDAPQILLSREEFSALWKDRGRVYALIPKARLGELDPGGMEILRVTDRVLVRNN